MLILMATYIGIDTDEALGIRCIPEAWRLLAVLWCRSMAMPASYTCDLN